MNETDNATRFEEFKSELLNWKNEHIEEYNRFAEQMNELEEDSYVR